MTIAGRPLLDRVISHQGLLGVLPSVEWEQSTGQWAVADWQCCVAGKVTVGLASQLYGIPSYPPMSLWPQEGDQHHAYTLLCRV